MGFIAAMRWAANKEPYLFAAGVAVVVGCALPAVVPAWRRARGYETWVMDQSMQNPYLNNYHVSKRKEPTFDEHTVIAGFLKKHPDPYRQ
mmetsp:Transcript_16410/g.34297  ORF Transcript_16410/g.34297 Transcript_16410/m.34297 type:complete len:90 (-) Transcript_16410:69-338(-)